jgi:hypothetical protein
MQDIRMTVNKIIDDFIEQARSNPAKQHDIRTSIQKAITTHARDVNLVYIVGNLEPYQLLQFIRCSLVRT